MKHRHKEPCKECPWRKSHPKGWLGGHSAEFYADAVQSGEVPACHLTDVHGPEDNRTSFCAGALTTMKNQCILPYKQPGAREAIDDTERSNECFSHVALFYKHHTGKDYKPEIMRGFSV